SCRMSSDPGAAAARDRRWGEVSAGELDALGGVPGVAPLRAFVEGHLTPTPNPDRRTMMHADHRGTQRLAAMGAALIVGCGPPPRSLDDIPPGPMLRGPECAGYNGNGRLSGSLHGKRDLARRVAMRL